MRNATRVLPVVLVVPLAFLTGCRGDVEAADEGHVRLPVLSQAKRPIISDQNPASPYTAETAEAMGQPGVDAVAPGHSTASANRPGEPDEAAGVPEAKPEYIPRPGPVPILATGDSESRAATTDDPASLHEQGKQIKVVNTVVARVNDQIITREDLFSEMHSLMAIWRKELSPQEFEDRVRMELRLRLRAEISRILVLREARKQFHDDQSEVLEKEVEKERQRQIALAGGSEAKWHNRLAAGGLTEQQWREIQKEWLTVQIFLHGYVTPRLTVTRQEMVDHYEKTRQSKYVVKPQAHMCLVKLRLEDHADQEEMLALARSLVAKARSGEDFARLAQAFSKGPKATEGGDWGMMHYGSHRVEAVNDALRTLPVGGVSDPILDGGNLYIVKVAGRIEGRVMPFTEVQDECRDAVKAAKRQKLVARYVASLYEKNHVEIYEDAL